jgi:hypothetical protein
MHGHTGPILSNASASSADHKWIGGKGVLVARATWGGGSVSLQVKSHDETNYITPTDGSLTADGMFEFELPPCTIRIAVATATGVYARIDRVPE